MVNVARVLLTLFLSFGALANAARAACTQQDFAAAVDQSAAALRKLNAEFQPKLKEQMARYKEAAGVKEGAYEDAALDAIRDPRLDELDAKSGDLIIKIDQLGRVGDDAQLDCNKLNDISASSSELIAVIRAKSSYMLGRLEAKTKEAEGKKAAAKEPAAPQPAKPKAQTAQKPPAPPAKPAASEPSKQAAASDAYDAAKPKQWSDGTQVELRQNSGPAAPDPGAAFMEPEKEGYTIEEIRDASEGFFGPISTNVAAVLEHAFKTSGRPSAYVLGTEGGGAFLAGLRYGSGTLYMRNMAGQTKVYWHGPSVGYDAGVEGGRTLFLIYHMANPQDLYRTYTEINGAAFLVGGVGITFLKGGDVIMAPVRSGLGLRLGANFGYVRFTDKATWNPF